MITRLWEFMPTRQVSRGVSGQMVKRPSRSGPRIQGDGTTMSFIQTGKIELRSDNAIETTGGNTSTFTRVTFPTPFPSGTEVVVFPLTQTFNGPETPGIRIHEVTTT